MSENPSKPNDHSKTKSPTKQETSLVEKDTLIEEGTPAKETKQRV